MKATAFIDKYLARLLMISFFLPLQWEVWAVMASCGYFVIRTAVEKDYPPGNHYWWALLLGCGYFLYVFAIPFTPAEYKIVVQNICEYRAALIVMPFIFAFMSQRHKQAILDERMFFAIACLISTTLGNIAFINTYFLNPVKMPPGWHLSHTDYRIFFETFSGIHPTYTGMYLCFSVCILLLAPKPAKVWLNILKIVSMYVLIVFLMALMPKSPLIALVIIVAHYGYRQRTHLYKYKWVFAAMAVAMAAACIFIPFIGQRVGEMFSFFGFGKPSSIANNSMHVRKLIWETNSSMAAEYWLTGVGPGMMQHLLRQHYFFNSLSYGFYVGYYDPHSEYFTQMLSFGIAGLLVVLAVLAAHFTKAIRQKNLLYLYLLIIIFTSFFTESVLSRQHGVMFYAIFTAMFFFYRNRKTEELKG
jgi:hypothetical protein